MGIGLLAATGPATELLVAIKLRRFGLRKN
jgi:hypothetical protein